MRPSGSFPFHPQPIQPRQGEVWFADLNPPTGHEQAGVRPCLIVSVNQFSSGPADMIIILPITSRDRRIPFHIEVQPPEGGLTVRSFIKCEQIRAISKQRLRNPMGFIQPNTMNLVQDRVHILLGL